MGVEVFGGEHPSAVVRGQDQRVAVGMAGTGLLGQPAQPAADGVGVDGAGVTDALQQVGRAGQGLLLMLVATVDQGDVVGAVVAADVTDDLGDRPAELVTDRDDSCAAELAGFDVQQVVEASVGQGPAEHVEGCQLTRLLDPQPAGQQQLQQAPVPEREPLRGDHGPVVRELAQRLLSLVPAPQREGANVWDLALQVQHRRGQPGLLASANLGETGVCRSWRVKTTLDGACPANGESLSVAHVEMSAKNTRISISHECGVVRSSWPLRGWLRWVARATSIACGTNPRAWAGVTWEHEVTSGWFSRR